MQKTITSTEAGRRVMLGNDPQLTENASAKLARKQAEARAAAEAVNGYRADTTTPLAEPTIGKVKLDTIPEPPAFTRPAARRPVERTKEPIMQWATGLTTTRRDIYAGWLIESHQSEALDDALLAAGFDCVNIKHGKGNVVEHWCLPVASLFVVCDGVQTISEMAGTTDRYGIAFGWRDNDGRPQSVLRCRVLVQELCAVGYCQPLLLSVKSTLTGDLLGCLIRHYEVLDSINPIRAAAGKPPINVPFYAVALTLGTGVEVARGSGQTKEITPMCEVGARDKAYVLTHWCKREWVQAIEQLADETVVWSRGESVKIAAGDAPEGEG